jgi:hypothetical protein
MIIVLGFRNCEMHSTLKRTQVLKKGWGIRNITNRDNWHSPWHRKHPSPIIGIILAIGSNEM